MGGGSVWFEQDAGDVCVGLDGVCAEDGERGVWGFDQFGRGMVGGVLNAASGGRTFLATGGGHDEWTGSIDGTWAVIWGCGCGCLDGGSGPPEGEGVRVRTDAHGAASDRGPGDTLLRPVRLPAGQPLVDASTRSSRSLTLSLRPGPICRRQR